MLVLATDVDAFNAVVPTAALPGSCESMACLSMCRKSGPERAIQYTFVKVLTPADLANWPPARLLRFACGQKVNTPGDSRTATPVATTDPRIWRMIPGAQVSADWLPARKYRRSRCDFREPEFASQTSPGADVGLRRASSIKLTRLHSTVVADIPPAFQINRASGGFAFTPGEPSGLPLAGVSKGDEAISLRGWLHLRINARISRHYSLHWVTPGEENILAGHSNPTQCGLEERRRQT